MSALPSIGRAAEVERSDLDLEADAAGALYERHFGRIYGYCLNRLGNREEAEDAAQTTFLNAFRGLRRGVVPDFESAWLFKIAENVCRERRRAAWRRGRVETIHDFQVSDGLAPAPQRPGDELVGLSEALAEMPENQRRAILLREWQGLSYREISAQLGVSKAAVETLIFRARRSLAHKLEQPPAWRRRLASLNSASLLASLKGLLGGGLAAKTAATAAALAGAALLAQGPLQDELGLAAPREGRATAVAAPAVDADAFERLLFAARPGTKKPLPLLAALITRPSFAETLPGAPDAPPPDASHTESQGGEPAAPLDARPAGEQHPAAAASAAEQPTGTTGPRPNGGASGSGALAPVTEDVPEVAPVSDAVGAIEDKVDDTVSVPSVEDVSDALPEKPALPDLPDAPAVPSTPALPPPPSVPDAPVTVPDVPKLP